MKNPVFNRQHIKEYFLYGSIAAALYLVPVLFFLSQIKYEHLYYICAGTALFMFVIFFYALQLVSRPYDRKRAVSMLIAGNLATLAGVAISVLLVLISFLCFFPDLFSERPVEEVIRNAPATIQPHHPSDLLFMIMLFTIFANTSVGSFVSVVTAYAGKKNQTGDKPAHLDKRISRDIRA
jgi:hypothetical protein